MQRFVQVWLWLSAATFAWIGIYFLVLPHEAAAAIDLHLGTDTALADVQATYGGMVLGVAFLWIWTALKPERYAAGLWAMVFIYGGLALGRLVAIGGGAQPDRLIWIFLAIEVAVTAISLGLLRRR
jgi:hypothetical protein